MTKSMYRFLLVLSVGITAWGSAAELPNIVIVYTDDLGFGDLSITNPEAAYKTPRIDTMARQGILFTDAHSPSTICSPSRYGLFSGQQIYRSTGRGGGAFEGPGGPSYLKPGTLLINTSRQDVIDEGAMLEAIEEKNIRVALDVFKNEPEGKTGEVSSVLGDNPNNTPLKRRWWAYQAHRPGPGTRQVPRHAVHHQRRPACGRRSALRR